jgi:hypothetical protein
MRFQLSIMALNLGIVVSAVLVKTHVLPTDVATPVLWVLVLTEFVTSVRVSLPGQGPTAGSWAKWRVGVSLVATWLVLPAVLVALVTSGSSDSAVTRVFANVPSGQRLTSDLDYFILFLVPILIILVPEYLHTKDRAGNKDSPVPTWLAGFACAATAIFIISLHFGGGILAKPAIGFLSVAAFGAATLLAPFYQFIASACLKRGAINTMDPWQWWSKWCHAYREMKGRDPAAPVQGDESAAAIQGAVGERAESDPSEHALSAPLDAAAPAGSDPDLHLQIG